MSLTSSIVLELFKAALAGLTAVVVFLIGQAVIRFVLDPLVEMRKLIGQLATDLVYYRNRFSHPPGNTTEEWIEATSTYRRHAAALRSLPLAVPFYNSLANLFSLPCRQQASEASSNLIGISNMTFDNPTRHDFAAKNEQFDTVHRVLNIPKD